MEPARHLGADRVGEWRERRVDQRHLAAQFKGGGCHLCADQATTHDQQPRTRHERLA
jgi:hypothetical protein